MVSTWTAATLAQSGQIRAIRPGSSAPGQLLDRDGHRNQVVNVDAGLVLDIHYTWRTRGRFA